jgi:hypothetical protein
MQIQKQKLPLMSKSTAIWLVENTALTFKQIADFCGFHELQIKAIADGEVAKGIVGINPIDTRQLTQKEIDRCTADPTARLQLIEIEINKPKKSAKTVKYTPIARRRDKPDAVFWIIKNYPETSDATIVKMIGTTKSTIEAIRSRTYWNINELKARDPVLLGLCSQSEIDALGVTKNKK